jgi:hypothetical protein
MNFESSQQKRLFYYNKIINLKIGNKTVSEKLSIDGISYINVAGPEFLLYNFIDPSVDLSNTFLQYKYKIKHFIFFYFDLLLNSVKKNKILNEFEIGNVEFLYLGFVDYMKFENLQPIAEYYEGRYNQLFINDKYISKKLYNNTSYKSLNILDFFKLKSLIQYNQLKRKLKRSINEILNSNEYNQLILDYPGIYDLKFKSNFIFFLNYRLKQILKYHICYNEFLIRLRSLKLCFSCDVADPRSRLIIEILNKKKINNILVQFGALSYLNIEWFFFNSTILATWGKVSKNYLIQMGIDEKKIHITGTPRYIRNKNIVPDKIKQIISEKNIVLYAPPHGLFDFESVNYINKMVLDFFNELNNFELYIKPHPLSTSKDLKIFQNSSTSYVIMDKDSSINNILNSCDIFINCGSTLIINALIQNKYVICIDAKNMNYFLKPYYNYDEISFASNNKELKELISKYIQKKEFNKNDYHENSLFLKDWVNYGNDDPINNISKIVKFLIHEN